MKIAVIRHIKNRINLIQIYKITINHKLKEKTAIRLIKLHSLQFLKFLFLALILDILKISILNSKKVKQVFIFLNLDDEELK